LFFWQLPHSLAIARLYADDYARAGFRLLPVVDRDGRSTERQIFANCLALLVVALLPTLLGMTGGLYFVSSLVLGIGFLICGALTVTSRSLAASRRVLLASLVYLPLLLGFMAADKL
jgi:protoheme IX farnesyltransferase